ncbi:MAG TPA: response regulator transcription factor [Solirubrobacteraceae bacterium]|jgi:DNA-binding NarL/FixJ family response regulator
MDPGTGGRSNHNGDPVPGDTVIAVSAEDETIRARIAAALELSGYELAFGCETVEQLIAGAPACNAELLVLALGFEPFTPDEGVARIRATLAGTPLVVVASGFVGSACRRLVPAEIEGFVHEGQIEHALVPTIRAVLAEQLCIPGSMRDTLAQPVFSHREKQVLELLLAGLTNNEIASRLFLSESTVKSHLASSFRKLGVSSRAEAARCVLAPDSGPELRALSLAIPPPALSDR